MNVPWVPLTLHLKTNRSLKTSAAASPALPVAEVGRPDLLVLPATHAGVIRDVLLGAPRPDRGHCPGHPRLTQQVSPASLACADWARGWEDGKTQKPYEPQITPRGSPIPCRTGHGRSGRSPHPQPQITGSWRTGHGSPSRPNPSWHRSPEMVHVPQTGDQ